MEGRAAPGEQTGPHCALRTLKVVRTLLRVASTCIRAYAWKIPFSE